MKRIFTNFSNVLAISLGQIKKHSTNSFITGLMFGSLFSLIVNIATIGVDEYLQKQRVFESIENEILDNYLEAGGVQDYHTKEKQKDPYFNIYFHHTNFSDRVWNSNEAIKYIMQLPPAVQIKLTTYYNINIRKFNEMASRGDFFYEQMLVKCIELFTPTVTSADRDSCNQFYFTSLDTNLGSAKAVGDASLDLLRDFHPTQDRLKNPFLKLLLGNDAVRILE